MIREFSAGNYRFIPSVFQYSAGAAAADGYEIERVRFDRLVPLAEGFALAAKYIQEAGRPLTAFCAARKRRRQSAAVPPPGCTSQRAQIPRPAAPAGRTGRARSRSHRPRRRRPNTGTQTE